VKRRALTPSAADREAASEIASSGLGRHHMTSPRYWLWERLYRRCHPSAQLDGPRYPYGHRFRDPSACLHCGNGDCPIHDDLPF
jgi:hypothetical protein